MPYTPSGFFCDRLIRERERRDGEGSLNKPIRFNSQEYSALRQECVLRKSLFEDDTFPATVESLGYKELGHKSNKVKNIVWKRPKVGGRGGGASNLGLTGGHGEEEQNIWDERHTCLEGSPAEGAGLEGSQKASADAWNVPAHLWRRS